MLPAGLTADPLPSSEVARVRSLLPTARTAAHLRVGACSCDLVRPRLSDPREDERHLRARYKALGLARERIIRELDRHRRSPSGVEEPRGGWRAALAGFLAEHARNAGPTVVRLSFQPASRAPEPVAPLTRTVSEIRADPGGWLQEGPPILVLR